MPEQTKWILAEALRKKMAVKPLNKITIQEIVDMCGFNRQTFYYHFRDIYDLLHWIFEYDAERILENRLTTETWADALLQVLRYIEENKEMCLCALRGMQHDMLSRFLYIDVEPLIKEVIEQIAQDETIDEPYKNFITHFYTLSIAATIEDWLQGNCKDMQISAEKLATLIDITISGNLQSAMQRYKDTFLK